MAFQRLNPETVHAPGGPYSHATEIPAGANMLFCAGQTGTAPDGGVPDGIEAQAEQAFGNLINVLHAAGYGPEDVVMLTIYLTRREDREGLQPVRVKYFGDLKPPSTFLIVQGLARPEFLVEVEAVAAKA